MSIVTPDWVSDAIFYQIFPDRFASSARVPKTGLHLEPWEAPPTVFGFKGGDLFGVLERLDYLQDLGVTAIYLNPIFASASNHRYHTYDYFTVDPLLGGHAALRALLDAAHARRMRVILDGVFNHASRGFWQFHHTLENGAASPYVDWFFFDSDRLLGKRHFAAYPDKATQAALRRGEGSLSAVGYNAWWNLPALPKFNTATPAVREFLWGVATHWIEFGIDGWRLDVPAEIDDDAFWCEFRRRVKAANPEAYIVGEIWHAAPRWLQGDQFDAVMNYPVAAACLGFFGGARLDLSAARRPHSFRHLTAFTAFEFADQIDSNLSLYDPAIIRAQFNLLDSHDTTRFLTSVSGDVSALRLALLFLFTYPGTPCIYYGDEIGLDGSHDPGCRKAFPWDPAHWNHELRNAVKQYTALRHSSPALRRGDYYRLYAEAEIYAYARSLGDETVVVMLNVAGDVRTLDLALTPLTTFPEAFYDVWNGTAWPVTDGVLRGLRLPPRSSVVLTSTAA